MDATLVFTETARRERCSVSLILADLSITAAPLRPSDAEPRFVVRAKGLVEADRGIMHLRRAAESQSDLGATLYFAPEGQAARATGRYRLSLQERSRDGFMWEIALTSAPGVRVAPDRRRDVRTGQPHPAPGVLQNPTALP